ncbi:MAG TPA: hypothetical protein DCP92_11585 [Nitrospiraceae bacterium]|jgi:prepilin-type N-terminal cleavage/methylation domain-containing protein|nr:hypothetical protein [Nitrospiraceae bacterium]
MIRKQHGFTLVELMITLVVFTFALSAAIRVFVPIVGKFKQQSKIAETNVEGLVGLELLKTDLEHAGYGLPWCFPNNSITYAETTAAPASALNDATGAGDYPPRALAAVDNITFNGNVNGNANITSIATGSDYLTIKSALVSGTDAAQKWTYLVAQNAPTPRIWGPPAGTLGTSDPSATDYVIVINPVPSQACPANCLVMNGGTTFGTLNQGYTQYNAGFPGAFTPSASLSPLQTYLIYDIAPGPGTAGTTLTGPLNMPFNRADYFVGIPATLPSRCASGTGVLYKAILGQNTMAFSPSYTTPLLDCVADMRVIFGLDTNGDGIIDTYSNADGRHVDDATPITGQGLQRTASYVQSILTSQSNLSQYRSSVVEVRIYILAHEGQQDQGFDFRLSGPGNPVNMGSLWTGETNIARPFDLTTLGDLNWMHYRWKVYTIVVKLQNVQ